MSDDFEAIRAGLMWLALWYLFVWGCVHQVATTTLDRIEHRQRVSLVRTAFMLSFTPTKLIPRPDSAAFTRDNLLIAYRATLARSYPRMIISGALTLGLMAWIMTVP
jgi:hypothetical protein